MKVGEEDMRLPILNDLKSRGQINYATSIYKNVIMPLRITKMPLLGLKCWLIHLDDGQCCGNSLKLNINVQAPKFVSPKYLKIIKNKI